MASGVAPYDTNMRAQALVAEHRDRIFTQTSRMFAILMPVQWIAAVAAALWISPRTWSGASSSIHVHVWMAIFLGSAITSLPVYLALTRPERSLTPYAIAVGQMLMSALLIDLTGGRIETHFHVFGSLAFLHRRGCGSCSARRVFSPIGFWAPDRQSLALGGTRRMGRI